MLLRNCSEGAGLEVFNREGGGGDFVIEQLWGVSFYVYLFFSHENLFMKYIHYSSLYFRYVYQKYCP